MEFVNVVVGDFQNIKESATQKLQNKDSNNEEEQDRIPETLISEH